MEFKTKITVGKEAINMKKILFCSKYGSEDREETGKLLSVEHSVIWDIKCGLWEKQR